MYELDINVYNFKIKLFSVYLWFFLQKLFAQFYYIFTWKVTWNYAYSPFNIQVCIPRYWMVREVRSS